jgi:hypothetical protein
MTSSYIELLEYVNRDRPLDMHHHDNHFYDVCIDIITTLENCETLTVNECKSIMRLHINPEMYNGAQLEPSLQWLLELGLVINVDGRIRLGTVPTPSSKKRRLNH